MTPACEGPRALTSGPPESSPARLQQRPQLPFSTVTETHTHTGIQKRRECPCHGEPSHTHTLTHRGPPLHSQPHHGDTTATLHCHGYQGTCVCVRVCVSEQMTGCCYGHIEETVWPFGAPQSSCCVEILGSRVPNTRLLTGPK